MRPQRNARWIAPAAIAVILIATSCGSGGSSGTGATSGTGTGTGTDSGTGTGSGTGTTTTVAISAHPQSVTAAVGSSVTLSVTATGTGTLSYQWYRGATAISGATSASYTIGTLAATDAGRYRVRVTDTSGPVVSAVAVVTPTSGGVAVDAWELTEGFNPADEISNVTFAHTITLTGSPGGVTVGASGLTSSGTTGGATTFTDGAKTVVIDTSVSPIAITSAITGGVVKFVLTGTFPTGLKITSASAFGLALTDVAISSTAGAAIYVNSAVRTFVVLSGSNSLTESSDASAAVNAAFYSKGALLFSGNGALTVTAGPAYETNAIQSKTHVRLAEATLNLKTRYNPPSKDLNTENTYGLSATSAFVMDGGVLLITSADELTGAPASVPVGWGRGIGVKGAEGSTGFIVINDGVLSITTHDKAMTAKWKCYDPDTPSDSDGDRVCNSSDPNPFVTINGGTVTIRATGITCDPADRMTYNTTTCTGAASASVSPEGIEAKSILTINGGTVDVQATDDAMNVGISYTNPHGNAVVINGGYVNAASSDNDGIDANAIASPGITINGGVVVANGVGAPEEGFDADRYTVALNGGMVIGSGGNNSSVDASSTADYGTVSRLTTGKTLAIWKGTSSQGALVFAYQVPSTTVTSALSAIVSHPALVAGGSYTYFFADASAVTCSEWFHGLCVGSMSAAYSALGSGTALTVR